MRQQDIRLPEMAIGLGVWSQRNGRFYPVPAIKEQGRALLDTFNCRSLLVYLDPQSHVPEAMFAEANNCQWQWQDLCLNSGEVVRNGRLLDAAGHAKVISRPQQIFTRWYGFAYTFPGCEIYGST